MTVELHQYYILRCQEGVVWHSVEEMQNDLDGIESDGASSGLKMNGCYAHCNGTDEAVQTGEVCLVLELMVHVVR